MRLRVLVVDDSTLMRRLIHDILGADPALEVVGEAADGTEAVRLIHELRPDVVTLDIEMPGMSGMEVLGYVMSEIPTPIVMLTGLRDPDLAVQALSLGAVDFLNKPSGTISVDLYKIKEELIRKVKMAPLANLRQLRRGVEDTKAYERAMLRLETPRAPPIGGKAPAWAVVIGASTGGPPVLEQILSSNLLDLPAGFLVVQHMPSGFTASLARRLDGISDLAVVEAKERMPFLAGWAYIAPGGHHLIVAEDAGLDEILVRLDDSPPRGTLRPAVDVTMTTVAALYGPRTLGILLTGMGSDGAEGFRAIREAGGHTVAQDRQTSLIYGMPRVVAEQGLADHVLPGQEIAPAICRIVSSEV
jgi:two-component system chemotaxis response regulator CheB